MPHQGKVFANLNPVWEKFGSITIRKVSETCCLILVPFVQTRDWVLEVGYWQAGNVAFSVFPWSSDGNLAAHELTFAPTWAILKNVPPQLYSLAGISVVASGIGEPLHTKKSRFDPYHFGDTKVKVEINLETPPPEIVEVCDSVGNSVRINVEYPRLPPKCLNCGRFGHFLNRCNRPLLKGGKFKDHKKTGGLAVVNTASELTQDKVPSEKDQVQENEAPGAQEITREEENKQSYRLKRRARSKSKRRARSRSRARALSSPTEVIGSEVLAQGRTAEVASEENPPMRIPKATEVTDTKKTRSNKEGSSEAEPKGKDVVFDQKEEESVWLTKHSKAYKRALRQEALWRA